MKRISVKQQIVVGLFLSLLISLLGQQTLLLEPGYSFVSFPINIVTEGNNPTIGISSNEPSLESTYTKELLPTGTAFIPPFTTVDEVIMLRIKFFINDLPLIESVSNLPKGRLSISKDGNYSIQLVDTVGTIAYELPFEPIFLAGEPASKREETTMLFILPEIAGIKTIIVHTPFGKVFHDFD
jgi:hypothetical protein